MHQRGLVIRLALLGLCALVACRDFVRPIDGPLATATILGRVASPNGIGVAGVSVVVEARSQSSCANSRMDRDSVLTDANGEYRATVMNWGLEYTVCGRVRVRPASSFAADSVDRTPVRMHHLSPDTVRVDIVLQPSA